jgi:hypothetical protein
MMFSMLSIRRVALVVTLLFLMANAGATQASRAPSEWQPTDPPADIVALHATISQSLVSIVCGSAVGTGVSVYIEWSDADSAAGWKSYVVTNHSLVKDCLSDEVPLTSNGVSGVGVVSGWDVPSNLATVTTTMEIPYIESSPVPTPVKGQWIAVMSVDSDSSTIIEAGVIDTLSQSAFSTSFLDPTKFQGGPVFNNRGTIIGLMTPTGEVAGTPRFCGPAVYVCEPSERWRDDLRVAGAPTNVSVVAGDGEVTVSWKPPSDDGGADIYAYDAFVKPGGDRCTALDGELSCTLSGLIDGQPYTFTVVPYTIVGAGFSSAPSEVITLGSPETTPTSIDPDLTNETSVVTSETDDGSGSNAMIPILVALLVLIIAGGGVVVRRRRS